MRWKNKRRKQRGLTGEKQKEKEKKRKEKLGDKGGNKYERYLWNARIVQIWECTLVVPEDKRFFCATL